MCVSFVLRFDDNYDRVLVLGNAQLAQMVGARGPNMQTNAACAGSTLAVAMAQVCDGIGIGIDIGIGTGCLGQFFLSQL